MNLWRWLTTPDPAPGLTTSKLLKLVVRVVLFAVVATVISSLLSLTPLRPYLNTWWGSLIFILILYVPVARFMTLDTLPRTRGAAARTGKDAGGKDAGAAASSAQRRKERNRFAGVKKGPPKYGGRR